MALLAPRSSLRPAISSVGNRKPESRSLVHLALGPDASPMALDDAGNGCQPDAGSLEVARIVQALKRLEQLVGIRHVEARTVVPYPQDPFPIFIERRPEFDACRRSLRSIFPRVF